MIGTYTLDQVHQGEALACLSRLPDESVDAVVTDPPYSSGGLSLADRSADPVKKYAQNGRSKHATFHGDNRDGRSWGFWSTLWLAECNRVVRAGGYAMVFTDWRMLPTATDALQAGGFIWRGIIAWDKGEGARAPHTGYARHQCEYVVWGTKGPCPKAPGRGPLRGCFRVPVRRTEKFHLTGKPVPLMRELLGLLPAGARVVDPFAGSGSTGVACVERKLHFLGFELSSHYVGVANERIRAAAALGRRAA